jgi:ATP-dependent protease ClpP protease subunit
LYHVVLSCISRYKKVDFYSYSQIDKHITLIFTGRLIEMSNFYRKHSDDDDNVWDEPMYNKKRQKLSNLDNIMGYFVDKYEKAIFIAGDREIHFNAHVDGETITRMKKLISMIVDENKDKLVNFDDEGKVPAERANDPDFVITYIVDSPGGSVHDILNFVDYIYFLRGTFSNIKFTSVITGMVASAGTIMCVVADKKQMTRFAFAMIHELSTGVSRTNYTRIMTHSKFVKDLHMALVAIYQECRGIGLDNVEETKKLEDQLIRETWLTPTEYKELKFIDEIIAIKK